MSNAKVHVTHSSGSTLEALSYNIPSIVINQIGFDYYNHLIQNGNLKFIDLKSENFVEDFLNYVNEN
jgi:UDP-N-acetylglucosamine 2-epimerase